MKDILKLAALADLPTPESVERELEDLPREHVERVCDKWICRLGGRLTAGRYLARWMAARGLDAARLSREWGCDVTPLLAAPDEVDAATCAAVALRIASRAGAPYRPLVQALAAAVAEHGFETAAPVRKAARRTPRE
jgi:hypothetical protein